MKWASIETATIGRRGRREFGRRREYRQRRGYPVRRGSALLLCTLAIAVISLASIAVIRSNERAVANLDGIRVSRQARQDSEGAIQRSIAAIRIAPTTVGTLPLPRSYPNGTSLELTSLSPNATRIQFYLYEGSATPAAELVVDPTALAGAVSPPAPAE